MMGLEMIYKYTNTAVIKFTKNGVWFLELHFQTESKWRWGLARKTLCTTLKNAKKKNTQLIETPLYRAPENLSDKPYTH